MNLLTGIVLIIIAISAYRGMKNGFIRTVFSIFSMILALVLTLWLSPIVSKALQSNENILNYFAKKVEQALPTEEITTKVNETNYIEKLSLPGALKHTIVENNNPDTYVALAVDNFISYISYSIASIIINALSFIITYIIVIIVLRALCVVLDIISKLPILHQINKLSGLVVGVLQGVILVWLLFVLLTAITGTEIGQQAFAMINESPALSYIYNNNLLLKFITNISKILFE